MVLKTPGEIELMDEANRIVHRVLDGIAEQIRPGVTTRELDRAAERTIREAGAVPAFLDYRGFPATLCTSINAVPVSLSRRPPPAEASTKSSIFAGPLRKSASRHLSRIRSSRTCVGMARK